MDVLLEENILARGQKVSEHHPDKRFQTNIVAKYLKNIMKFQVDIVNHFLINKNSTIVRRATESKCRLLDVFAN